MAEKLELHIVTGAAGVGKSTFGKMLAKRLKAALLDSDTLTEAVVRAGMQAAGLAPTDRDSPDYKRIFRDAVYRCLFATAAENLLHTSVVIVGPFTRELQDPFWPQQIHQQLGVQPTIWFLTCDDEVRRQRIIQRGNPRDRQKLHSWPRQTPDGLRPEPAFETHIIDTEKSIQTHDLPTTRPHHQHGPD